MKTHGYVLGFALLGAACGDDVSAGAQDGGSTGGESTGPVASSGPTSPSGTSGATQGSSETTGDEVPETCAARRHSLLGDLPCGRLGVGDLDADGVDDLYAIDGPTNGFLGIANASRRLYSYRGLDPLLGAPEIHCCMDAVDPSSASTLDVNGDGFDDVVVTAQKAEVNGDVGNTFEDVTLWMRGPAGGFLPGGRLSRTSAGRGQHVAAGRLLTDSAGLAVAQREVVWLSRPDGINLVIADTPITLEGAPLALGATDLDGDGIDDLVALLPEHLVLVRSPGDGSLDVQGTYPTPVGASSMHLADLDGDGRDDVLLIGADELAFAQLEADGPRWSTQELAADGPTALVDINGDGVLDLATANGAQLQVRLGSGDGTFGGATTLSTALGEDVVDLKAGDFDDDGRSELAVCDAQGILVVQP